MSTRIPYQQTLSHKILKAVQHLPLRQWLLLALLSLIAPSCWLNANPHGSKASTEIRSEALARWHTGATLILVNETRLQRVQIPDVGYFEESIFLSDNSALTYTIQKGEHCYIIDLGRTAHMSRFSLKNLSASGKFRLFAANALENADSNSWVPVTSAIKFQSGTTPAVRFDEVEARFLMICLKITQPGEIGNFGLTRLSNEERALPRQVTLVSEVTLPCREVVSRRLTFRCGFIA